MKKRSRRNIHYVHLPVDLNKCLNVSATEQVLGKKIARSYGLSFGQWPITNEEHGSPSKWQPKTGPSTQRRKVTREYSLPLKGQDKKVCLKFFIKTLGYTTDRVVVEAAKSVSKSPISAVSPDERGAVPCLFTKDRNVIKKHRNNLSFHPQINHYRHEHARSVRYIPRDLKEYSVILYNIFLWYES